MRGHFKTEEEYDLMMLLKRNKEQVVNQIFHKYEREYKVLKADSYDSWELNMDRKAFMDNEWVLGLDHWLASKNTPLEACLIGNSSDNILVVTADINSFIPSYSRIKDVAKRVGLPHDEVEQLQIYQLFESELGDREVSLFVYLL